MSDTEPTPGPSQKRRRVPDPPSFLFSPLKKRTKRGGMNSSEKTMAINLYKFFLKSEEAYPVKGEILKNTAQIMGTSEKTISRILNEYKTTGNVVSPDRSKVKYEIIENLDDFTLSAIKRKVHQFYLNNELPTINKVLRAVNDDEDLPSFKRTSMFKIMKKLKFKYCKRERRSILLDRQDLMQWRQTYLQKIKDFRTEKRKIYYTDETWVNAGHTAKYVWCDEEIESCRQAFLSGLTTGLKNPQKGKRLIITHIGSEDGFLEGGEWVFEAKKTDAEGDYHGEMDSHNYEKWFKKILDKLEPGSVVVIDNAPYHSRHAERVPNMQWRKADIQAWLKEKNIEFEEREKKALLLAKFSKNDFKKKVVDEMAAEKNVIVLRLPPYHCELNPIELIWAQLKSYVGRNNKTFKLPEVKDLVNEGLKKISAASWKKCIEHVIKEEDKMMHLDGILDEASVVPTPSFIIHVSEESESETSSE